MAKHRVIMPVCTATNKARTDARLRRIGSESGERLRDHASCGDTAIDGGPSERFPLRELRLLTFVAQRARIAAMAAMAAIAMLIALSPAAALAHAIVVSSTPQPKSTVAAGVTDIRLDFNSAIDLRRSRLALVGPDGVESTLTLVDSPPGTLAGRADLARPGVWVVHWQVLSRDGHITRGDIRFFVRDAGASATR